MKLSVIVPCLNAAQTIEDLLQALCEQVWPGEWEIILADNGSTDETLKRIERYRGRIPCLKVVQAAARRGASHARNVGAYAAAGESLLFCDADDLPAQGWAVAMESALRDHDFVASRLDFERLNSLSARAARDRTQVDGLQRFSFLPFPHAGAGTLGVKRSLHHAIGGFDESILVCEDIDYCMRLQQQAKPLEFVPSAVLHCRLRATSGGVYTQASRYAENEVYLYKKYGAPPAWELWRWRAYLQSWRCVMRRIPELMRTAEGKTLLAWRVGRLMGLLKGSIRFGAPPVMAE